MIEEPGNNDKTRRISFKGRTCVYDEQYIPDALLPIFVTFFFLEDGFRSGPTVAGCTTGDNQKPVQKTLNSEQNFLKT